MNERESYQASRDARREVASHPVRSGGHDEHIARFVGALLYGEARRESPDGEGRAEPPGPEPPGPEPPGPEPPGPEPSRDDDPG